MGKDHLQVARTYFEAFREGDLDAVFSQLASECLVQHGKEKAQPAHEFYPAVATLIASFTIEVHGYYFEAETGNVIIHFSFTQYRDGAERTTEAVDIIAFNEDDEIISVKVLTEN